MVETYNGNPNLKKVAVPYPFSEEEIIEYAKCSKDPAYFIRTYMKIIHIDHGVIPFDLYQYQEKMIHAFEENRYCIVKSSRQSGKTQGVVGYLLWYALFNQHKTVAILANRADQARKILGRIQLSYERLPKFLQQGVLEWNKGSIFLENGTSIMSDSTSGSAARGNAVSLLYLDEFCFVHRNQQADFWKSTYPTISSGKQSKVIITSTPNGFDLFYKLWVDSEEGRNSFKRVEVDWWDVPGRDEAWKKETIANMGEKEFKQEFNTEFIGSADTLISPEKIRSLAFISPIKNIYDNSLAIYKEPIKGHNYFGIVDTSRGVGIDNSAFVIIDVSSFPYEVVAVYKNPDIEPALYPDHVFSVGNSYNNAFLLVEINDIGGQVVDTLHNELEYENLVFTTFKGRGGQQIGGGFGSSFQKGVRTTSSVKKIGCANLRTMIEHDQLIVNDCSIVEELSTFIRKKSSYEADSGCHDDLVMCLVLFAWAANQEYFKEASNTNFREKLLEERHNMIDNDILPVGFVDDGINDPVTGEDIFSSEYW